MSAPGSDVVSDEVRELTRLWWLLLLGGIVSLVIGVMLLVWPNETLEVIAILLGIELLFIGALQIALAFGSPRERAPVHFCEGRSRESPV
jgi:uncharacterized membrane protein HdeD (DUF308 family)